VETKEKGKKLENEDSSGSVGTKNEKKPEDEVISGNEARDPDESDATWRIQKYQMRWKHRDKLKQPSAWLGDEHINAAIDILWNFKLRHKRFQRGVYVTEQNKSITLLCLQQLYLRGNH
jgi:hypothetical protein